MPSVTELLEDYSIYVILSLRGAEPGFHWGIFVPTSKPRGEVWHAVNRSGGWSVDIRTTSGVPSSVSLCLCFKVGSVTSQNWDAFKATLRGLPGSSKPSPNTREAFTCRVWVKDALLALHNARLIHLTEDISNIEQAAVEKAESNRNNVEQGTGGAMVWNSTNFSATS
ncbi:MAG: hypothetical protein M1820_002393 [Bogoriella megaspora]|nr:MAG: hypothetical protein M1820_002393 [Bogoriella megaspora]